MCTMYAIRLDDTWYLGKTRDPVKWMRLDDEIKLFPQSKDDSVAKYLIQNPNPLEDGYYGGINEHDVAFIATYIHVADNQVSYIRRPYVRLILEAKTAKEGIDIIKGFNPRVGGNMFIADPNECFSVEGVPDQYHIEQITSPSVLTNHFLHLPHQNVTFSFPNRENWSRSRYHRASELLNQAKSLEDLKAILQDRHGHEDKVAICNLTDEESACEVSTHSAFIFDTANKTAHYAQGNPLQVPFKPFTFN